MRNIEIIMTKEEIKNIIRENKGILEKYKVKQ